MAFHGMTWLRWHHGTVSSPKFALAAKQANTNVASAIAVWASLLEAASAAEDRGTLPAIDCDELDCALGLDTGVSARLIEAFVPRGLLTGNRAGIAVWDAQQVKRERDGNTSTDRVRAHRERKRQQQPCNAGETPGNTIDRERDSVPNGTDAESASPPPPASVDNSPKPENQPTEGSATADDWRDASAVLERGGCPKGQCRPFIGRLRKDFTDAVIRQAIAAAAEAVPADARAYVTAACKRIAAPQAPPGVAADAAQTTADYLRGQALSDVQRAANAARAREARAALGLGARA